MVDVLNSRNTVAQGLDFAALGSNFLGNSWAKYCLERSGTAFG
jgi:hypothetical protein